MVVQDKEQAMKKTVVILIWAIVLTSLALGQVTDNDIYRGKLLPQLTENKSVAGSSAGRTTGFESVGRWFESSPAIKLPM